MPRNPDPTPRRTVTAAIPVVDADKLARLAREDHRSMAAYLEILIHNHLIEKELAEKERSEKEIAFYLAKKRAQEEGVIHIPAEAQKSFNGIHPLRRPSKEEKNR